MYKLGNFWLKKSILLLTFSCIVCSLFAQSDLPDAPNPPRLYVNLSKIFPQFLFATAAEQLEQKLEKFARETSNQIVVLVVDDFRGYEPAEYAAKIGDKWKIGHEQEDNGIIILIKPTGTKSERKLFIAPGRGLEGAIPDYTCKQIVENEMVPNFKNEDYATGIDAALNVLMPLAKGEFSSDQYAQNNSHKTFQILFIVIIFSLIIYFVFIRKNRNDSGGKGNNGGGSNRSYWGYYGAGYFGGSMGRGFGGGHSGGFGGGGFGGFGGGSFGGGGAGGSW
jgi:uncharacterized protein